MGEDGAAAGEGEGEGGRGGRGAAADGDGDGDGEGSGREGTDGEPEGETTDASFSPTGISPETDSVAGGGSCGTGAGDTEAGDVVGVGHGEDGSSAVMTME